MTTRDRIIEASSALFMQRGYTASGLKQISQDSGAPIGSLYHFFPGGKEELAAETLRRSGAAYQALVMAVFDSAPDVVSATRACFEGAAEVLRSSDFADACPIATVALEVSSTSEPMREACAEVFDAWITGASDRFAQEGIAPDRARELSIHFLCALEGAFVLARALRSTEPLIAAGEAACAALREELAA